MSDNRHTTVREELGIERAPRCDDDGNICVVPPYNGLPFQFYLTSDGQQSTDINLNGNYTTPTDFYHQAFARFDIYSIVINISDNANFVQGDYGAISGGLINGIKFLIITDSVEFPIFQTDNWPIKKNYEWLNLTPNVVLTSFSGIAQTLTVEFNAIKGYGKALQLVTGDRFIVRLNDNFTGLVSHTVAVKGIVYI